MDQANKLRDLIQQRNNKTEETKKTLSARIITITSGKGGVGKTNLAINMAILLKRHNERVVLIDADFGLANVEVLFGICPQYNFGDVLTGLVTIESALTMTPMGIPFLSGGSGLTALTGMTDKQMAVLTDSFIYLDNMTDILLIDTGAGVSRQVVNFVVASQETIVVTTPDPTSMTDAYALIKTVKDSATELPVFKLIVNQVESPSEGVDVYDKLSRVCDRFLGIKLLSMGNIPNDNHLIRAVKRQEPVALLYPNAESTRCMEAICLKLLNIPPLERRTGIKHFVNRLIGRAEFNAGAR